MVCLKNVMKIFILSETNIPIEHLLVQSQQWKTRKRCEICSKLIKTPERRQRPRSGGVFLLTLNIFHTFL